MKESGLFVVGTPIGNLQDISLRALEVLAAVDWVAAEDTRRTARLLEQHGIRASLKSLHEHNEERVTRDLLDRLEAGQSVALVSDAGTPLISDPGYRLVSAARERGLPVHAVPGPSAVTAALSVGGLPTDRFVFEGFLPSRENARRKRLEALRNEPRTLVLFEASHRIQACLGDLADVFGEQRPAVLCRELTKQFETVRRAPLGALRDWVAREPDQRKGEFVLLVRGAEEAPDRSLEDARALAEALLEHLPASKAAAVAARYHGARRKDVYRALTGER
jgi:16S rRNA (cytidine1402-2'-O)-methyltransferase